MPPSPKVKASAACRRTRRRAGLEHRAREQVAQRDNVRGGSASCPAAASSCPGERDQRDVVLPGVAADEVRRLGRGERLERAGAPAADRAVAVVVSSTPARAPGTAPARPPARPSAARRTAPHPRAPSRSPAPARAPAAAAQRRETATSPHLTTASQQAAIIGEFGPRSSTRVAGHQREVPSTSTRQIRRPAHATGRRCTTPRRCAARRARRGRPANRRVEQLDRGVQSAARDSAAPAGRAGSRATARAAAGGRGRRCRRGRSGTSSGLRSVCRGGPARRRRGRGAQAPAFSRSLRPMISFCTSRSRPRRYPQRAGLAVQALDTEPFFTPSPAEELQPRGRPPAAPTRSRPSSPSRLRVCARRCPSRPRCRAATRRGRSAASTRRSRSPCPASGGLRQLEVGERAAEHPPRTARARGPRRARAARKPSAAAATDERKMSRFDIASLKPPPTSPSSEDAGTRQPSERERRERVGATTSMRSAIDRPGASAVDDEGGDASSSVTGFLVGPVTVRRAHEGHVEVRDPAVGDPGLRAVDHPVVAVAARAPRRHRRDVRPGVRLRQRERGDRLAARDLRQPPRAQRVAAGERDRPAAQPLHREREVGEAVVARERLAQQAQRTRLQHTAARRRATAGTA